MKKTVSENQGKGSLVLLPAKGEMQVILCNVFLLVSKVVLQNRCNDSSSTTCGDRKLSPLQGWRWRSWGRRGCLGSYMRSGEKAGSQHWLHSPYKRHQHWQGRARGFVSLLNRCAWHQSCSYDISLRCRCPLALWTSGKISSRRRKCCWPLGGKWELLPWLPATMHITEEYSLNTTV